MPKLSGELMSEYINIYKLPEYDARVITDDRDTAFYFNELLKFTKNYKAAANWLLGPIKSYLNENAYEIRDFKVSPHVMAELIAAIDGGKTNFATAAEKVFPEIVKNPEEAPLAILERLNLLQSSDEGMIKELAQDVLAKYPEKVAEYKGGKVGLMGLFVGEVMKASKGKADPKLTNKILSELLG
jgi:aspartyl-tRNA(Asn)/glutamyl-tRNA(Gln) amidotransferase subunit B